MPEDKECCARIERWMYVFLVMIILIITALAYIVYSLSTK
jgi:hypothetical protein